MHRCSNNCDIVRSFSESRAFPQKASVLLTMLDRNDNYEVSIEQVKLTETVLIRSENNRPIIRRLVAAINIRKDSQLSVN